MPPVPCQDPNSSSNVALTEWVYWSVTHNESFMLFARSIFRLLFSSYPFLFNARMATGRDLQIELHNEK